MCSSVCMSVVVGVSTRQQSGTDVVKFRFLLQLGLRVWREESGNSQLVEAVDTRGRYSPAFRQREGSAQFSAPAAAQEVISQAVQSFIPVWHFATSWTAARQASLSITVSRSLLKLMSIESLMPSNYLILCCPIFILPSIFPSIRVFSNESVLPIRWPKYWSFIFSISPSNVYSGLISFGMDWFDLLAVQGTLKSLLQHHSSKASILPCLAFFIVELSHPYMTTGKTIVLTRQTFVGKVMSLLFNTLSNFVIAFLPRNKHLLVSRLQSPTTVIWEPKKIKSFHCFHFFPFYLLWSGRTRCHDLIFFF